MIVNKAINKTRDLSVLQLFEILQLEYIVCEIRYKIYPVSITNRGGTVVYLRDYWKKIMEGKKERILDIAKRKFLPCIFDDNRIKEDFRNKIIPKIGYPKFIYKDSTQQLIQEKWDLHNYYARNCDVRVINNEGKTLVGNIVYVNFNEKIVKVAIKDSEIIESFDFDVVTRILEF